MKTITCREMGGMCDDPMTASTPDEMIGHGMAHLEAAHPDMAKTVRETPSDDPMMVEWKKNFDATWAATPEDA